MSEPPFGLLNRCFHQNFEGLSEGRDSYPPLASCVVKADLILYAYEFVADSRP